MGKEPAVHSLGTESDHIKQSKQSWACPSCLRLVPCCRSIFVAASFLPTRISILDVAFFLDRGLLSRDERACPSSRRQRSPSHQQIPSLLILRRSGGSIAESGASTCRPRLLQLRFLGQDQSAPRFELGSTAATSDGAEGEIERGGIRGVGGDQVSPFASGLESPSQGARTCLGFFIAVELRKEHRGALSFRPGHPLDLSHLRPTA